MREVVLFIAMSLDGYIADSDGGVGWLSGQEADIEDQDSYSEFARDIDTVVMGWNTYHQIVTELSPDEWVYSDFCTYVITHNKAASDERILFTAENPLDLVERLKRHNGKGIWICGGADLAQQFIRAGLIDRYHISIIPMLLGDGIRLFGELPAEQKLSLVRMKSANGIAELVYRQRSPQ